MASVFHDQLIDCLPHLRAFAIMITRDRSRADDLVQDAVVRALAKVHLFTPGTNFKAWIFTILRNQHMDAIRRRKWEAVTPGEEKREPVQIMPANQDDHLVLDELRQALARLPVNQREVLLLVASGLSYEEVAQSCGCPIGTIKSRVARARRELHAALLGEERTSTGELAEATSKARARRQASIDSAILSLGAI